MIKSLKTRNKSLTILFDSSNIYLKFCFGWHLPIFGSAPLEKYVCVPNSILALDMFMFAPKCVFWGKANWVICKRLWKKIELAIPILTLNYILNKIQFLQVWEENNFLCIIKGIYSKHDLFVSVSKLFEIILAPFPLK